MSKSFKPLGLLFALLTCTCFYTLALSNVHEKPLNKEDKQLSRWDIPLVRLIITDAKQYPNDADLASIEVNIIDVIRKGESNLHKGAIKGRWHVYRSTTPKKTDMDNLIESTDENRFFSLINSELICFAGYTQKEIVLHADRCLLDSMENRETASTFARSKPISVFLYEYAWLSILLFPPIGFVLILAFPRTGMAVAALSFPAGVYILMQQRDYDALIVYPVLIIAGIITIFGFVRWLHQMVKEEQEDKKAREHETPNSD